MEKIRELIERLCPEGVVTKKLSEISKVERGKRVVRKDLLETGNIPVYQNSLTPLGFAEISNYPAKTAFVISAGAAGEVGYSKTEYWGADDCLSIVVNNDIDSRFLYYFLKVKEAFLKSQVRGGAIKRLSKDTLEDLCIPLPPLSIQQEIVRILDSFTQLQSNLETELAARQKQYEYYRNKLLTFDENDESVEWKTLGDIGEVRMCKRILKEQTNSIAGIPFYKIGTFGKIADAFISERVYNEYKQKYNYPQKGDILISAAGTIGRTVEFDGTPSYFQDSNIVWIEHKEEMVLNRYLLYFYSIAKWKVECGGSVARLYNDNLKATDIPIPSLQRQREIVSTLDAFESLVSNIKQEIEARKKQYEYYREQLLTFE